MFGRRTVWGSGCTEGSSGSWGQNIITVTPGCFSSGSSALKHKHHLFSYFIGRSEGRSQRRILNIQFVGLAGRHLLVVVCAGPAEASGPEDLDQVYNGSLTT